MHITGKTIIKASVVILAGLFGTGVYLEYKELRDKERDEFEKDVKRAVDNDFETPEFNPEPTSEVIKKAAKKTVTDFVEAVKEDPAPFIEGCAIGAFASICYIAGIHDGVDNTTVAAMKGINDAWVDGTLLGFAGGRQFTRDHIKTSNPETAENILNNLDIYEKLHKGSDDMKFNPHELENDPVVMHHYNYMKENMREVDE